MKPSGAPNGRLKRNIPNSVTVLSLCSGLTSLRMTLTDQLEPAIYLILIAVVLDGLDGRMARFLNAESKFGAELDSLADFLCFGIAPGLLLYRFIFDGTAMAGVGWAAVLFLVVCCMLRLARFNVSTPETSGEGKPVFVGVPAPAVAFLALMPIYLLQSGLEPGPFFQVFFTLYLVGIGLLAISRIPTFSPKMLRLRRKHMRLMPFAFAAAVVLVLSFYWYAFTFIAIIYLISLPLLATRYK